MKEVTNSIVKLTQPIQRGETEITEVLLREPKGGDLRGVYLADLMQMDVATVGKVVDRISTPMIDPATFAELPPVDLMAISMEVVSFFVDTRSTLPA